MAKTNTTKKVEEVVVPTAVVADNATTTTEDATVTTEIKAPSKADQAQVIFTEEAAKGEEKLRARTMARFSAELQMSTACGSTYFQNAKKKAAGEKVKHYYKPKSEKPANEPTDDVNEDAVLFNVKKEDGTVESFMKLEDANQSIEANGGELISEEEAATLLA